MGKSFFKTKKKIGLGSYILFIITWKCICNFERHSEGCGCNRLSIL